MAGQIPVKRQTAEKIAEGSCKGRNTKIGPDHKDHKTNGSKKLCRAGVRPL